MRIVFHSFTMGDVDDVDIYVAPPIADWQKTEQGKWVMENAQDLSYDVRPDFRSFGSLVTVTGILPDIKATEYFLKWGQ